MNKLKAFGIGALTLGTLALAGCKEYIIECADLEQQDMKVVNKEVTTFMGDEIITFYGKNRFFKIKGSEWYHKFELGNTVRISYRPRYMLTFEDTNNDGRKEFVESRFLDNSVLDAQLVSKEK